MPFTWYCNRGRDLHGTLKEDAKGINIESRSRGWKPLKIKPFARFLSNGTCKCQLHSRTLAAVAKNVAKNPTQTWGV
jgi:hypothetical protein